jgi:cytochrome c551/c552
MGSGGGGKFGVPYLNANSLGINPWPLVGQATAQGQQGMANMYSDLGLGGGTNVAGKQVGPSSSDVADQAAIGKEGAAEGTQLGLQNVNLQAQELPQLASLAMSQAQSNAAGVEDAGFLAGSVGGLV